MHCRVICPWTLSQRGSVSILVTLKWQSSHVLTAGRDSRPAVQGSEETLGAEGETWHGCLRQGTHHFPTQCVKCFLSKQ